MKFYCIDCGKYIDGAENLKYVNESRGEFWGSPCYETMCYCPYCDGDVISEEDDDFPKEEDEEDDIIEAARELVEEISKAPNHYSRNPLDDLDDLEDDEDD